MGSLQAHKLGAEKELGFAIWESQENLEPVADSDSCLPAHPLCHVWGSGICKSSSLSHSKALAQASKALLLCEASSQALQMSCPYTCQRLADLISNG